MSSWKDNFKRNLIIKYAETKMNGYCRHLSKSIPWIQRKSMANTIEAHCRVLLHALLSKNEKQSFRQNKFIVDSIFEYTLGKSENLLKTNKHTKDIKTYMQLNSFIVFDEISKGLASNKNKKAIKFNIEKQLSDIQEEIDAKKSVRKILEEKISV